MNKLIMISMLFLLLFSCSKKEKGKDAVLIGIWQTPNKDLILNYRPEFVEITYLKGEQSYQMKGNWKTDKGFLVESVNGHTFKTKYKVEGEELTIQFQRSKRPTRLYRVNKG